MPCPTVADLATERLWDLSERTINEMVKVLPEHRSEEEALKLGKLHPFYRASVKNITLLVRSRYPGQPSPALDAIWAKQGVQATVEDLRAYWENERMKEGTPASIVEGSANEVSSSSLDPPADDPTPSPLPRIIKLKNYVPNAAELYGYELWCQKDAPSFFEQAHGRPLTLAQSLAPHTKDWTKSSLAMIMALTRIQFPDYPTPSFDHLWKSEVGIGSKRDALVDLWWRCARGDVDLEVEEKIALSSAWNEPSVQDLLSSLQEPRASKNVAQKQAPVDATLPLLQEMKHQLDKISESLAMPGSTADWTSVASNSSGRA